MADIFSLDLEKYVPFMIQANRISGNNQFAGKSTFKKRDTSLPPTKPNGQLVSAWKPDNDRNYTVYQYEGHRLRADNTNQPKRREQSLPPRKPQVDDDDLRQTLSAPQDAPLGPLPKINNYVIKDHAGVSTQAHDQGYSRNVRSKNNKFATSWANARVENSTVVTDSDARKKTQHDQHDSETNKHSKDERPAVSNTPEVAKQPGGTDKLHHGKDQHNQQSQKEKGVDIFHASPSNKDHVPSRITSVVSPYAQRKGKTSPNKPNPTDTHKTNSDNLVSPDSVTESKAKTLKKNWRTDFRKADPAPHVPERERKRQERELTYKPTTTDSKTIYKAYTAILIKNVKKDEDRSKTPHSDPDLYRLKTNVQSEKEHILNERETHSWIKIHSVYGSEKFKKQRKQCFIEKLSKVEADSIKQKQLEIQEKERKRNESKVRQHRQLMFVRKRFQQQQWRRFRTQYVTSRVLEHELMNRHKYGLPENYGEDSEVKDNSTKIRRKKKPNITQFDEDKAKQKYEKKFKQMFDINAGPTWDPSGKTPKMEGIDIVVVDVHDNEGNVKQQKKDVTKIVKEAENAIKSDNDASNKNKSLLTPGYGRSRNRGRSSHSRGRSSRSRGRSRGVSESKSRSQSRGRVSLDSLDLDDDDDDDDIFEKARRKYNLSVDDDDDDLSRR